MLCGYYAALRGSRVLLEAVMGGGVGAWLCGVRGCVVVVGWVRVNVLFCGGFDEALWCPRCRLEEPW